MIKNKQYYIDGGTDMVSNNKKEFIIQKKKDLENKCGSNPEIYEGWQEHP